MRKILMFSIAFLFLLSGAFAQEKICILFFYGEGCPACAQAKPFIEELESKYNDTIDVHKLELYNNLSNYNLYNKFCGIQKISVEQRKIPLVAIGNEFYVGVPQIKDNLEQKINQMLLSGERKCPLPDICNDINMTNNNQTLSFNPGNNRKSYSAPYFNFRTG